MIRNFSKPFKISTRISFYFSAKKSTKFIDASNPQILKSFENSLMIKEDFLSEEEEKSLLEEVDPYMKKLRYEYNHWDSVIFVLKRIKACIFDLRNYESTSANIFFLL